MGKSTQTVIYKKGLFFLGHNIYVLYMSQDFNMAESSAFAKQQDSDAVTSHPAASAATSKRCKNTSGQYCSGWAEFIRNLKAQDCCVLPCQRPYDVCHQCGRLSTIHQTSGTDNTQKYPGYENLSRDSYRQGFYRTLYAENS